MVFDWQKIIACNGLAEARRFIAEHPEACDEWPESNTLNSTFENRWTPLGSRAGTCMRSTCSTARAVYSPS